MSSVYGIKVSENSQFLLPFAPPLLDWTEEHYELYSLVETVLGFRKEVTPDEAEAIQKADEIEQALMSGDPDWVSKIEEFMNEGGDLDAFDFDTVLKDIEREELEDLGE